MTDSSDIAGSSRWSSTPAHATDLRDTTHRRTFDGMLTDMAKAESVDMVREGYGRAMGYSLGLYACRVVDIDQRAVLEHEAKTALQRHIERIMPLDDELVR